MPYTPGDFSATMAILFDNFSLGSLKTFFPPIDSATRKTALQALFNRSDKASLHLQKNLMKHWLFYAKCPPLDSTVLKLKSINSSLSYKIINLALVGRLRNAKSAHEQVLTNRFNQYLTSQDLSKITSALQALPYFIAIVRPTGEFFKKVIRAIAYMNNCSLADKEGKHGIENASPVLPPVSKELFNFNTANILLKALASIFEISMSGNVWHFFLYTMSLRTNLGKALRLDSINQINQLVFLLKTLDSKQLTYFVDLVKLAITSPLSPAQERDIFTQLHRLAKENKEDEGTERLKESQEAAILALMGRRALLIKIIPVLLDLPKLDRNKRDELIACLITHSWQDLKYDWQDLNYKKNAECLNVALPKLSQDQLTTLLNEIFQMQEKVKEVEKQTITRLPNLFHSSHLTAEQYGRLADILIKILDNLATSFNNIVLAEVWSLLSAVFKVLPGFLGSTLASSPIILENPISLEKKNQLIAKAKETAKTICSKPNFGDSLNKNCLTFLSEEDFKALFTSICSQFATIEEITTSLTPLLQASQLSHAQFTTLIEGLDKYFWNDDFWGDSEMEEEGKWHDAATVLTTIFKSSYLTKAQYDSFFNRIADLMQKSFIFQKGFIFAIKTFPAILHSTHLTREQFNAIISLLSQLNYDELTTEGGVTDVLEAVFTSVELSQEQFDLLIDVSLKQDFTVDLLKITPIVFQVTKLKTRESIRLSEKQTEKLLQKGINELTKISPVNQQNLKVFLAAPLMINTIKKPAYLSQLVAALMDKEDIEVVNFLCHLLISEKLSIEELNCLKVDRPLFDLLPIVNDLYKSQQLPNAYPNFLAARKRPKCEENEGRQSNIQPIGCLPLG